MKNITKWGLGGATAGAGTLGIDALREGANFGQTATEIAGAVSWAGEGINNIIGKGAEYVENVPFIGEAAPFAFPVIAGAKGAHMAASKYGPDSPWFRGLATVAGGTLGGAATMTFLGKYLAIAGLGYTAWKSPKVLEWIARRGVGFPVQTVKGIGDLGKRMKNAATAKNWSTGTDGVFA